MSEPDIEAAKRALRRMLAGKDGYLDMIPLRLIEALVKDPRAQSDLSEREKQVITGASHGLTNEQIAELYGISVHTVMTHMTRIRHKLLAKNKAHACSVALRKKLID